VPADYPDLVMRMPADTFSPSARAFAFFFSR